MNHGDILKQLGGASIVAKELRARGVEVMDVTVRSWSLDGRSIPARYWVHIVDIAAVAGVVCSIDALARVVAAPSENAA